MRTPALSLPVREPPRGSRWPAAVLDRSGLEMMRDFAARALPDPPVTHLTGLRVEEAHPGTVTATMPASPWWQSGAGVFLAGGIAFVADLALSGAVLTTTPPGTLATTAQLSVSYLRPATIASEQLVGRGRTIHTTRSLGLAEANIEDARGRLLGHATTRCVIMQADRGMLPAQAPHTSPTERAPRLDPHLRGVEGDVLRQEFWDATPGIEFARSVAKGALTPPISLLFDWRGVEAREGEFTMAMPASPWLANAFGSVYGGALALLADVATTLAVASTVPAATAYSPLDMTVHFLRPVLPDGGELRARGRVVHRGRTIAVTSCEIVDAKGRLVAIASGSTLVLPGRRWARPVSVAEEAGRELK